MDKSGVDSPQLTPVNPLTGETPAPLITGRDACATGTTGRDVCATGTTGRDACATGRGKPPIAYPTLMLLLLCLIWGGTFPATRSAVTVTDPLHFLTLRFSLAVVFVTPFILIKLLRISSSDKSNLKHERETFARGIWIGLFLLAGFILQTVGMRYTTASRSGFFTSLLVVIAPILAGLFRTSRMAAVAWFGIPISVAGIYLLADPQAGGLNLGDWLTIGCALVFAIQMIVLEAVAKRGRDTWILTYAQMLTVCIGALIWSLIEGVSFTITSTGWLAVIYTGLFGGIVAVWMQTRFQPDVPAGHAAIVFTTEPVFAALFAWMLLGEGWTLRGLIGAGLILLARGVSGVGSIRGSHKRADFMSG